ncbi:MAG: hypothetical protein KY461_04270 [Actinobacteria bacterium]|nr:hypothetical protein [Actinomycetota bacterium]
MRVLALVLVALLIAADPIHVGTPDGRVQVTADGGGGADGGSATVEGNVGAQPFQTGVAADHDSLRIEDPPMAEAWEFSADGHHAEREELYGPRAANASLGTGGLTANVARDGVLSGLNWPGPGLYDHLAYLNVSRDWDNHGSADTAGSFGGLGTGWLREDFGWEVVDQRWSDAETGTLETVLSSEAEDLTVTVTDVVHPTEDLLVRNFRFSRDVTEPFAYYGNFNPTTSRAPRVPSVFDAFADPVLDFATTYSETEGALLHFRPYRVDPASFTRLATSQPDAATAQDAVAGGFGPGVYLAVAGQDRPASFQAGLETVGLVRAEGEGTPLLDPYYDLADGSLSNSPAAFGKTAGALAGLPSDPDGSYTVYLSAAERPGDALDTIRDARRRGFRAIRAAADADWRRWIGRARLPDTEDGATLDVSRRALMLIRTAQDRTTGAIVANTTAQTPYREDWVRDGAFFNYALLLAGYDDMVAAHNDFYRRIYRPGGTWDSFYYTDGAEAGAMFPYEIDSQAFALWALWLPMEFGADVDYLADVYPAIRETADALLLCTDPTNDMQCYAPEDDAYRPTQESQGAATVYLAFRSAVAAAEAMGVEPSPAWARRAEELRTATLEELCDDDGCRGGRGGIYLVWPSRLLDPDDPRTAELTQSHLARFADQLDRRVRRQEPVVGGFFQYPMESILALAPAWEHPDADARLDAAVRWLTSDVVEPGVLHFGERIYRDGPRSHLHTVGFPHIWSGAETYLAAAFAEGLTGCRRGVDRIGEATCRPGR